MDSCTPVFNLQQIINQIARIALHIRHGRSADEVFDAAVLEVRELLDSDRVSLARLLPDSRGVVVAESVGADWSPTIGETIRDRCFENPDRVSAVEDIYAIEIEPGGCELFTRFQVRASLAVPIFQVHREAAGANGNEKLTHTPSPPVWGFLIAHQCGAPRPWNNSEIVLLEQVSMVLGIAIEQANLTQQLHQERAIAREAKAQLRKLAAQSLPPCQSLQVQKSCELNTQLEARVQRRTAQLEGANRLLLGQKQVLEAIATDTALPEILALLIRAIEATSSDMIGSILLLDSTQPHLRHGVAPSLPESYSQAFDGVAIGPRVCSCGTAVYRRERVIVSDIATDPLWSEFRDFALSYGLRACWSEPIFGNNGEVVGTFAMYYRQPRYPSAEDLELIETAAYLAGVAIARKRTEEALWNSEERFRATFEQAAVGIIHVAFEGEVLRANQKLCDIFGYTHEEMLNLTIQKVTYPEDLELDLDRARSLLAGELETYSLEKRYIRKNGGIFWGNLTVSLRRDAEGEPKYFIGVVQDISDRKQAEEERSRLVAILEASTDFIGTADPQGNSLWLNQSFKTLLGINSDREVLELSIPQFHPDWALEIVKNEGIPAALRDGVWVGETALKQHNGSPIPVSQMIIAHKSKSGSIEYFSTIVRDLTERKQAEAKLQESYNLLRTVIDSTPDSIVVKDRESRFRLANAALAAIFDKSAEELVGKDDYLLLPPDIVAQIQADDRRILASGGSDTFEEELLVRGEKRIYLTTKTVYRDSQGQIQGLVAFVRDIHELKQTQEALRHANEELEVRVRQRTAELMAANSALAQSEERLRLFIENAPIAIAMFDREMRYLAMSKRWLSDNGLQECDSIGRSCYDVFPDLSEPWKKIHQRCLAGLVAKCDEDSVSYADGTMEWMRWEIHPWHDSNGKVGGIIMFTEDITKRKHTEEQLKQLNAELARSNQELEQFAYIASHDLREPLRKIKSYTDLLAKRYRGKLDVKADQYIAYITDGTSRMQALIQDLLTYSRVSTGELVCVPTDLQVVLHQILADLSPIVRENNAVITADSLPIVNVNPLQMGQLLQNLIANGIKFRRSEPPRIEIQASLKGSFWQISIRDNGIGIAPEYCDRIFVIFQRLHTRDEYPGTGIGLAVCKKIVERHGGEIWVESELGQGTTFYCTFPA